MALVCPRCSNIYDSAAGCPRCGAPAPLSETDPADLGRGPRWQQTTWGRILIGLILSQGLFYALRHLLTGALLAYHGGTSQELWEDVRNLLLLQAIQVVSLIAGGMLAGGGQRRGLVLGAVVGTWNGVFSVLLRQNPAQELTMVGLYGQPLLHTAFGAVGGLIGSIIWAPIPNVVLPPDLNPPKKKAKRKPVSPFAGKVAWFRVLAGSAFAVAGTLSATMIFQKVLDVSGGKLGTSHEMQDRLITWEIKALAVILGGMLAGATTPNGLKQGLVVGFAASLVLIGVQAPMTDAWFQVAILIMISTYSLALVGGWFGGQLFPPIVKMDRRARNLGAPTW
jgi:hypothetical protein